MNKFELLEIKSKSVADLAGEAAKLLATLEADEFWSETLLTNSEISDGFQTLFDATTKLITGLDECIPGLQQTTLIAS